MKNPLISIITPAYNHERYIAECIESVLIQTYQNWEMIIIDDCSRDSTYDVVLEYAKQDNRIKAFRHKKNYGALNLDKTYNEALSMAKGEWIAILEGDDCWPHYRLERQIETIQNLSEYVVLLHGNAALILEDMKKVTIPKKTFSFYKLPPFGITYDAFEYLIYGINQVYSQTVLIKKQALLKIGGFIQKPKEIRLVDYPTWLRLSRVGKFYQDKTILGFWRRHQLSITMNNPDKIASALVDAIKEFLKEEELKDWLKKECLGKIQFLVAIRQAILNGNFSLAQTFLKDIENCINSNALSIDKISKLKIFIYKLVIFTKQRWILKLLYKFKIYKIDTILCEYKPFFFKDLAKEGKILCVE